MITAAQTLRLEKPDDKFEIIPRPRAPDNAGPIEWRIRCHDCPGKVRIPCHKGQEWLADDDPAIYARSRRVDGQLYRAPQKSSASEQRRTASGSPCFGVDTASLSMLYNALLHCPSAIDDQKRQADSDSEVGPFASTTLCFRRRSRSLCLS